MIRGDKLIDRLGEAAKAKKARLEKARAMAPTNDPDFAERQAARREAALARDARNAERKATRLAEAKIKAEAEAAERLAREQALAEETAARIARAANLEIEQKAARDARYAARKARKK